jgi:ParB family chromosome partitioning protein
MSIKDRLAKKTGDLINVLPAPIKDEDSSLVAEVKLPRTGPGQMLAYRSHMQENNQRVQELQEQIREFEGTIPVKLINPVLIRASKWANRHDTSFANVEFFALKSEIESAGGNVQPIRVRALPDVPGEFEIIFGHRRHQACLQLGIPISAIVDKVNDKELFQAMDRENRAREDLSPYEQGEMYRRALDEGLYPSLRGLASELGVDPGNASKAIAIARLPSEVLATFESPTQIQYRWGQELIAAMQKDPEGVIARAKAIRFSAKHLPPAEALERLLGKKKSAKPEVREFKLRGRAVGNISRKSDGSVALSLKSGVLTDDAFSRLHASIEDLIAGLN